jgi:putative phosphoribosyl transferase
LTSINVSGYDGGDNRLIAWKKTMGQEGSSVVSVRLPPDDREALLGLPAEATASGVARGIVLFAHGSGSGRRSPRNRFVAQSLQRAGLATLLFDLLTDIEAASRANVFDIALLADRLDQAATWARACVELQNLPLGFFGASTGAAAALVAASRRADVGAVVSRGGRPDLAGPALSRVSAATLLIVGGDDTEVLALNQAACRRLTSECRLEVVPGATHLFEEGDALEMVAALARKWFLRHLAAVSARAVGTASPVRGGGRAPRVDP